MIGKKIERRISRQVFFLSIRKDPKMSKSRTHSINTSSSKALDKFTALANLY
jgi:hypothetical protein